MFQDVRGGLGFGRIMGNIGDGGDLASLLVPCSDFKFSSCIV